MFPAFTNCPSALLAPSLFDSESLPFFVEPTPFFMSEELKVHLHHSYTSLKSNVIYSLFSFSISLNPRARESISNSDLLPGLYEKINRINPASSSVSNKNSSLVNVSIELMQLMVKAEIAAQTISSPASAYPE
mgnify:CR=1 FL=1